MRDSLKMCKSRRAQEDSSLHGRGHVQQGAFDGAGGVQEACRRRGKDGDG